MSGETWAILLAAGESTRMGRLKPLLPWAGVTLIEWQIAQLRDAGVSQVVAVLGSRAPEVEPLVTAAGATPVVNMLFREGRASSIRAAAAAVDATARRIVIVGVDQPRPAWVTRRLLAKSSESRALILSPMFMGRGGHPIVLDASLLEELLRVDEATLGLRAITERHRAEAIGVEFENSCVIVDLNTPVEYEAALAAFNRGEWSEDFRPPR